MPMAYHVRTSFRLLTPWLARHRSFMAFSLVNLRVTNKPVSLFLFETYQWILKFLMRAQLNHLPFLWVPKLSHIMEKEYVLVKFFDLPKIKLNLQSGDLRATWSWPRATSCMVLWSCKKNTIWVSLEKWGRASLVKSRVSICYITQNSWGVGASYRS